MAQETWGLKLDLELKEKVQDIIKGNFDSSKEFMEQLVNMYELNQLKQGENVLTQEVEELEALTRRMNGLFINANAKINSLLMDKDTRLGQQIELKQQLIEKLQLELTKCEEEKNAISSINDNLVHLNNECLEQVNQLIKSTNTLEDLISQYKEKNDTLTGLLQEYKNDHEQNKEMQTELHRLTNEVFQLNSEKVNQTKEMGYLEEKLQRQQQTHQNTFAELQASQTKEMKQLQEKLQLQQQTHEHILSELHLKHSQECDLIAIKNDVSLTQRILEIQEDYQTQLHQLQTAHNKEIEQYQSKYKQLLEQLEQKKSSTSNKKTAKKD